MNQGRKARRAGKPVNLDALYKDAEPELVAQWDGTTDRVAYVYLGAPGKRPVIGWLDRSGSTDRLLEIADHVRQGDPAAKVKKLQEMAVRVLQPHPEGDLQCVVMAYTGAELREFPPSDFQQIRASGETEKAKSARRSLINRLGETAARVLERRVAAGGSLDDAVVVILDPADAGAAPMFKAIDAVSTKRSAHRDDVPMMAILELGAVLSPVLATLRPREVEAMRRQPGFGKVRVLCIAHGGFTAGALEYQVKPS